MGSYQFDPKKPRQITQILKMKLYAAVALFGLAAIKASPIPDGLFDNAASDDCEDISEPAELPDIDAPVFDIAAPVDEQPDCEGEASEEDPIPVTQAPSKDKDPVEPPCYDDNDDNNDPVDPVVIMKDDGQSESNPLDYESQDSYDDYY